MQELSYAPHAPVDLARPSPLTPLCGATQDRQQPCAESAASGFQVTWAQHLDEVRMAQRLRHEVFCNEMGARLASPLPGHDIDLFDDYCEHLLVRANATGQVIGTYRVLTPSQAQKAGSTYGDTEFDLSALQHLRPHMLELGRSCVHAQHRQGGVIMALWGALFAFMRQHRLSAMMGCASMPMQHNGVDSADAASSVWQQLRRHHMAAAHLQVQPRKPLPQLAHASAGHIEPPALIKGYLRLGAKVLGAPAWDADFNMADLPLLLHSADVPARYGRHFAGAL